MKAYVITDPEKFKEAATMMKWQAEKKKAENFAKVWSAQTRKGDEKAKQISARIEVGRTAQLFQQIGDKRQRKKHLKRGRERFRLTGALVVKRTAADGGESVIPHGNKRKHGAGKSDDKKHGKRRAGKECHEYSCRPTDVITGGALFLLVQ